MTYQETLEYLYAQLPVFQRVGGSAYKEGLDNSLALDKIFDHPHRKYKTIHIGGTNGKGSTSHTLAAVLQQSGYKVGLYTSPHLIDFRERIRVEGEMISEQYVIDFVDKYKVEYEKINPSFFELTMMMAFCYFAYKEVDYAIIEVGLGGRLDSTNIISPILSIITNISLDHTQFLGESLAKITTEKAGIIKLHTPVVIGEAVGEVKQIFAKKAILENAPIVFAQETTPILAHKKQTDGSWLYQTVGLHDLNGELGGFAQVKNTSTILCAIGELKKLNVQISDKAVYSGFANVCKLTGLMGRWQIIPDQKCKVICDTAHNVAGLKYVVQQLATEKFVTLRIVLGMVNDKEIDKMLALLPKEALYYFTKANLPRALNEEELKAKAEIFGLKGNTYPTVPEATKAALKEATPAGLIFIGGSSFVVADALPMFKLGL